MVNPAYWDRIYQRPEELGRELAPRLRCLSLAWARFNKWDRLALADVDTDHNLTVMARNIVVVARIDSPKAPPFQPARDKLGLHRTS